MARAQRTIDELHADSRTLVYEFEMLCGTAWLVSTLDRRKERIAYNAIIESFAIHCRALVSFFFDHNTHHDTDVIASDFFPNPAAWISRHSTDAFFDGAKTQANKQIAHMTSERRNLNSLGGKDGHWDLSAIVKSLNSVMADFLRDAPVQNLDPKARLTLLGIVAATRQKFVSPPPARSPIPKPPAVPQKDQQGQAQTDVRTIGPNLTGKTSP